MAHFSTLYLPLPTLCQETTPLFAYSGARLNKIHLVAAKPAPLSFLSLLREMMNPGRPCFTGLFGSHKPLHFASPAAKRKPRVNGFGCNVVIISSRLFLVLKTQLFLPFSLCLKKSCWQQIFKRFTCAALVSSPLTVCFMSKLYCEIKCIFVQVGIGEDKKSPPN